MDLSTLPGFDGVAPAGILQGLSGPDCRGPLGVGLWIPRQDGVGSEVGHAELYEKVSDLMMYGRGQPWAQFYMCWIRMCWIRQIR